MAGTPLTLLWGSAFHLLSGPCGRFYSLWSGLLAVGPLCLRFSWVVVRVGGGLLGGGWVVVWGGGRLGFLGGVGWVGFGGWGAGWVGFRRAGACGLVCLASLVGVLALLVCLFFRVLVWVAWVAVGWFRLAGLLVGSLGLPRAQCFL